VTPRVAIIGAGLAGLSAADRLLARNFEVVLIDAGHQAGGRLCTRTVDFAPGRTAAFDLGPQVLYARAHDSTLATSLGRIRELAHRIGRRELLQTRQIGRIGMRDETVGLLPPSGLAVSGGMRELVFGLLARHHTVIDYRDHTRAERIERSRDGVKVHTRSLRDGFEDVVHAHIVIVTAPVPQSLELLASSSLVLPDDLLASLRGIEYTRCFALHGLFAGRGTLPPGGVWLAEGPLEWIVDNQRKGVSSSGPAITALTPPEWSAEFWDEPDERVMSLLLGALSSWVGSPLPEAMPILHRWRYAKPVNPLKTLCAFVRDSSLVLAGDGFAAGAADPVDAAIISGEAAAARSAAHFTVLSRQDDRLRALRPRRYTLEIAVSTVDEAIAAQSGGADRLEVSSGLEIGGLTPSLAAFLSIRQRVSLPLYVLLRPRAGGFHYSDWEFDVMVRDARTFLAEGAAGIVFGIFANGGIDRDRCRRLTDQAQQRAVFHRAFDLLPEPMATLDELIELGFERVLTSGHARTAESGSTRLAALVQHGGWQIEVLPAGNIRPDNVADLVRETRCEQVHSSARLPQPDIDLCDQPRFAQAMGCNERGYRSAISIEIVTGLRSELDRLARDQDEE
jgi:copper homeostasis protein